MVITPQPSYVVFPPNKPVRLRVRRAYQEDRPILDGRTRQPKVVNTLVLEVTEVDGVARETQASFIAFKAQQTLAPIINSGEIFRRVVEITYRPAGYQTEYEVHLL